QRVNTSLFHALVAYDMSGFGRPSETPAAEGAVRAVLPLGFATPECSDGRFLQMCSRAPRLFRNWMRVMGLDHLYDDPAFHQMPDRIPSKKDMDMIYEHVHAKMLEKTPEEWIEIFLKEDVGGDPFLTPKELLRHPQTIANQRAIELDDPNVGKTVQIGPLANFSQTPAVIEKSAPTLGEHTEEIISTLSSTEPTRQFTPKGESSRRYPLEGVTVVDNAFFYAAPFGATLLAEMGARVIKIEPPTGDPTRRNTVNDYLKTMQGKESVVLDLKTEEGVSALYKIVEKADIFLHNFRPGVPESLKIDYETLSKINPRLVYVYGSCFGSQGPWSKRPGFHSSPNAMGGSGIVESGEGNPPKDRVYPDPAGALGVATAMMMGLQSRERTGKGQYVETTMINSSGFIMSHWSLDYANKPDDPVPDQGQHGYNALHRLYETKDGWLFVQTIKEREWQAFASSIGKPELLNDSRFATAEERSLNDGALANILAETLRERDASDWEIRLLADGVPAVRADNIDHHEFMINEAHALENNISIEDHLSTGERFYRHANCVEFPTMENQVLSPMPLGWATEPILREVGLSDQEIQSLHDRGVTVALGHGL
ncbi:CoA transferase, partial [Dehalococcoidia bacterium]|nr:CoA transferase [Dehalococcoidia bacterium]